MAQEIQVNRDPIQNPYREFTYVLPVNGAETIFFAHSYFRVLALSSGAGLAVRWGGSGQQSSLISAGIGINIIEAVPSVTLINTGGNVVTVTIALSMGTVSDDRLTVSGTINTSITSAEALSDVADVSVAATSTVLVSAASARKTVVISNLAANGTVIRVGSSTTGATRGAEVPSGGSAALDTQGAVFVYNPSAAAISVGVTVLT